MAMNVHCDGERSKNLLPFGVTCLGRSGCELLLAFSIQRVFSFLFLSSERKKQSRKVVWDKEQVPVYSVAFWCSSTAVDATFIEFQKYLY